MTIRVTKITCYISDIFTDMVYMAVIGGRKAEEFKVDRGFIFFLKDQDNGSLFWGSKTN